eukprot:COSAG02_NODE_378_length_23535_cov_35.310164_10_plen_83_part_00
MLRTAPAGASILQAKTPVETRSPDGGMQHIVYVPATARARRVISAAGARIPTLRTYTSSEQACIACSVPAEYVGASGRTATL